MTERIEKTYAFLKEGFGSNNYFKEHPSEGAYRLEHSVRVAHLCRDIARAEGMDEEAATIAGLLHDVAYGQDWEEGYDWSNHGRDGAKIARPFLESLGLDGETVNDICYAIAIHVDDKADFEGRRTPFTETVGDADNIDRFDAYRVYESVRWQMRPEEHSRGENLEWLRGRLSRLEQLRDMKLGTPTAAALWKEKVDFQMDFFGRLLAQMERSALPEEQEERV